MPLILPKLIKPTRRKIITGLAAVLAMPYIARGQVPMTGAGLPVPAAGGGAWTPSSDTNLVAWYKGDAGQTNSGSPGFNVTAWADQSGNGRNVTNVGGGNPVSTASDVLNGLPVIRWTGGLNSQLVSANFTMPAQVSTFGVFKINSYNSFDRVVGFLKSGDATLNASTGSGLIFLCSSATSVQTSRAGNLQSFTTLAATYQQWGCAFLVNGTAQNTDYVNNGSGGAFTASGTSAFATAFGTPGAIWLGTEVGGGSPFSGVMAELWFTSSNVDATYLTHANTYLNTRWGV